MNVWTSAMRPWIGEAWLWAQAANAGSAPGAGPSAGSPAPVASTLILAIRRWCGSVTLAPQGTSANLSPALAWLAGLGLLWLACLLLQGPGKALYQTFDLVGHLRLLRSALQRFRRSGRLLAILLGTAVVAWTATQAIGFRNPSGRDDLVQLVKGRQLGELALSHGALAALTPLRDLVALGLLFPLLVAATILLFQYATDRWTTTVRLSPWTRARLARWASIGWIGASLYALYRLIGTVSGSGELPLSGCIYLEPLVIPPLMAISDGVLLAWVVVELRSAGLGDTDEQSFDIQGLISLIPSAILVCVLLVPARYASSALILGWQYVPPEFAGGEIGRWVRWSLGWGVLTLQVLAFPFQGMAGAIAWTRGTAGDAWSATVRLVRQEGGHLFGAVALSGALAGALAALSYGVILALPPQPWVLLSADAYAHYATILVGLLLLSGIIELAETTLPTARLAQSETADTPEPAHEGTNGHQAVRSGGEEIVVL